MEPLQGFRHGSNPWLSTISFALMELQTLASEAGCRWFDSTREHQAQLEAPRGISSRAVDIMNVQLELRMSRLCSLMAKLTPHKSYDLSSSLSGATTQRWQNGDCTRLLPWIDCRFESGPLPQSFWAVRRYPSRPRR